MTAINFKIDDNFFNYLKHIGYKRTNVPSGNKYFTNEKGNQVRVDEKRNLIGLLNKKGLLVCEDSTFSSREIDYFSRSGEL